MRALYTAATGMNAQQLRIDNIANNLANVSTTGFKKGRGSFEDLIYQQLPSGAAAANVKRPAELSIGSGTRMVAMHRDFSPGNLQESGNAYDLAIGGRGFFVVEDPDGKEYYTRDGRFESNAEGELVNSAGFRLSPGINIPSDASQIEIATDGAVSAYFSGETSPTALGSIRVVDFANAAGLSPEGSNLYSATPASGEPADIYAEDGLYVQQGFLESSNVDVAEELVNMIVAQRGYELASKVIQTADETFKTATAVKR